MKNIYKRISAAIIAIALTIMLLPTSENATIFADSAIWNGTADANWASGYTDKADTSAETFTISKAEQLAQLAVKVNSGLDFSGKTIELTDNIVLNDISNLANWSTSAPANTWTAIGCWGVPTNKQFSGTFDGKDHTVSGIYINIAAGYQGLFGMSNGTIKNVGVINSYIKVNGYYVGGVVGSNQNIITNCYNTGTVSGTFDYVGGVTGCNNGGTSNCYNCYNTGAVSGNSYVGGVTGVNNGSTVTNCYNTGAVSGTSYVGGVVGYKSSGTIANCYYYCCNVGIGGNGASQEGTTPFVKIGNSPLGTGKTTTITEQATADINTAWSNGLGAGFAVAFSDTYSSSNTGAATISDTTITGVSAGDSTISGRTMTITQNRLTSTGFDGTTNVITVPVSMPLSVTSNGGGTALPPPSYAITIGTLTHGSIIATPNTAASGDIITLTVNPTIGYRLKAGTLKYNSTVITQTAGVYSFTMPTGAVTITAEFELIPPTTYAITVDNLTHGSIIATPNTAASGDTITLTVNPASGYQLKTGTLKYNGTEITQTAGVYCFTMPAEAVTITAEFELILPTTYAITVAALTHGSIIATPNTAASGDTISLTVNPASGYRLKAGTLKYNGTAINGTTFIMPAEAVTITAEFELIPSNPFYPTSPSNPPSSSDPKTITVIETPTGIENPKLISVTANDNAFDQSVEVRLKDDAAAKQIIEQALNEKIADITKDVTIFPLDISLYIKGTDTKIQPNAGTSVEITCPIPTELLANKDNIKIVCVIDGKLQVLPTKVVLKNGVYCVVFTASHFSPYAFVVDKDGKLSTLAAGAPITDNANPIRDNGLPYMIVAIGLTALGIAYKRRKKVK